MPTPRAQWTLAVLDTLTDGRWHTRDALIDVAVRAVPPGRAFRRGEWRRGDGAAPAERTRGTAATSVATGARDIVRSSIWSLVRGGHAEQRTVDGTVLIRKTP